MFSIMSKKITTNLRIDENDWLQIKSMAAELGMSVNEYINYLVRSLSLNRELLDKIDEAPIWRLGDLAKRFKSEPMGELSEDDKIIYGQ